MRLIILGLIVSEFYLSAPPTLIVGATLCNSPIIIDYEPDHYIFASYGPGMRAKTDLYCAIKFISVIEASTSVIFIYY